MIKAAMKIKPDQALDMIRNAGPAECWASFQKLDNKERVMRFVFLPVGPLKEPAGSRPLKGNQVRVWDKDVNGYRTIDCDRLNWLIGADGVRLEVETA